MVGNIPLKEQNSSKYRYGYEYKNGKEFVEAWSKFRGGMMPNPHKPNSETQKKHIFGGQANK